MARYSSAFSPENSTSVRIMIVALALVVASFCGGCSANRAYEEPPMPAPEEPPMPAPSVPEPSDDPPTSNGGYWWNSWIVDQSSPGQEAGRVTAGGQYVVSFDLSPWKYERDLGPLVLSAEAGPELQTELERIQADRLRIRVFSIVSGVGLIPLGPGAETRAIAMDRLRDVQPAVWDGTGLVDFASSVQAVQIDVPVEAVAGGGCAAVTIAIWTAQQRAMRPLDYVSRVVAVADEQGNTPLCSSQRSERQLRTGLLSALSTSRGDADAGLQVLLTAETVRPTVLFVSPTLTTSWQLPNGVDSLFGSNGLRVELEAGWGGDYRAALRRLTDFLFPPQNSAASAALAQLRALASRTDP